MFSSIQPKPSSNEFKTNKGNKNLARQSHLIIVSFTLSWAKTSNIYKNKKQLKKKRF